MQTDRQRSSKEQNEQKFISFVLEEKPKKQKGKVTKVHGTKAKEKKACCANIFIKAMALWLFWGDCFFLLRHVSISQNLM